MSLKFKCPGCGNEKLEVIQTDVVMTSEIVDIDEEGYFEFDLTDSDGGNVDRFQCFKCGFVLKDDQGVSITTNEDVVGWIKNNCEQEKKAE